MPYIHHVHIHISFPLPLSILSGKGFFSRNGLKVTRTVRRAILRGTSCYTQKVWSSCVALSFPSFTFVSHTIPLIALKNGGYGWV